MIERNRYFRAIKTVLAAQPVCALLGPRQCGKTTLAKQLEQQYKNCHYFDLDTAVGRRSLANPELALNDLKGLIIIDEIQRQPELFTALRPLADKANSNTKYLILGSASPDIVRGASQSLAGRVGFVNLNGFDLMEIRITEWRKLWQRGGFPRSFLAHSQALSFNWRQSFIQTFLERDIPQLNLRIPDCRTSRGSRDIAQPSAPTHSSPSRCSTWSSSCKARSLLRKMGAPRKRQMRI